MQKFNIEITDTFGGAANYSWVRRYVIEANNVRGAINKLAREYGSGWRLDFDYGDMVRYNLAGACVCCFVSYADEVTV
jgi:hypothetical protein